MYLNIIEYGKEPDIMHIRRHTSRPLIIALILLVVSIPAYAAEDTLTTYANETYAVSMQYPAAWVDTEEIINENDLTMVAATEDFSQNLFLITRDVPSEPLQAYMETYTTGLLEWYDDATAEDSFVTLGGTEFGKLVIHEEAIGIVQVIYLGFGDAYAYEITLTLTPAYYAENGALLQAVEDSIAIG